MFYARAIQINSLLKKTNATFSRFKNFATDTALCYAKMFYIK